MDVAVADSLGTGSGCCEEGVKHENPLFDVDSGGLDARCAGLSKGTVTDSELVSNCGHVVSDGDGDESEGTQECFMCMQTAAETGEPLVVVCHCKTMPVHLRCLEAWRMGCTNPSSAVRCPSCREKYFAGSQYRASQLDPGSQQSTRSTPGGAQRMNAFRDNRTVFERHAHRFPIGVRRCVRNRGRLTVFPAANSTPIASDCRTVLMFFLVNIAAYTLALLALYWSCPQVRRMHLSALHTYVFCCGSRHSARTGQENSNTDVIRC